MTSITNFENKILKLEKAINNDDLINHRLQIVKKHGIRWVWIRFTQCLVKLFSSCTRQIPWKSYQPQRVVKALNRWVHNNGHPLNGKMEKSLERIYFRLDRQSFPPKVKECLFLARREGKSQEGCCGPANAQSAEEVRKVLQEKAPPGISFAPTLRRLLFEVHALPCL